MTPLVADDGLPLMTADGLAAVAECSDCCGPTGKYILAHVCGTYSGPPVYIDAVRAGYPLGQCAGAALAVPGITGARCVLGVGPAVDALPAGAVAVSNRTAGVVPTWTVGTDCCECHCGSRAARMVEVRDCVTTTRDTACCVANGAIPLKVTFLYKRVRTGQNFSETIVIEALPDVRVNNYLWEQKYRTTSTVALQSGTTVAVTDRWALQDSSGGVFVDDTFSGDQLAGFEVAYTPPPCGRQSDNVTSNLNILRTCMSYYKQYSYYQTSGAERSSIELSTRTAIDPSAVVSGCGGSCADAVQARAVNPEDLL